jgi:transposase
VELFEQIRRDRDREGLSKRALAARYGVHRRTVRQALGSAVPPPRKRPEGRSAPKLGEYRDLIDSWLVADLKAPAKQRHTARRVWERLRDEHGVAVSARQVRRYVRARRRALGLPVDEVCVPLCHEPAGEAEVDWGEAKVLLAGVLVKVYLFLMRACFSGACFVQAFPRETQQAFLEAHVAAVDWFGGCFGLVRYDNLGSAVKTVLRGRRRVETDRFIALRSHYLYEASFTRAGMQGAHEKGGSSYCTSWGWCGGFSFGVAPALAFDESGVVDVGRLVEPFVAVVELVGGEQPRGVPGLDRAVLHAESLCGFGDGEHAVGAEAVVAAGESVADAQAVNDGGGEWVAVEGALALLVEQSGDVSLGVVVEQLIDRVDQLGGGAAELADGRW